MSAEQVALIPQCEECRQVWLLSDEGRWQAHWIDDGPEEKLVTSLEDANARRLAGIRGQASSLLVSRAG